MPSENKSGYMAELDQWTQSVVIDPLYQDWGDVQNAPDRSVEDECQEHLLNTVAEIKKAIREKVLESYRNGQKAGPYNRPRPRK